MDTPNEHWQQGLLYLLRRGLGSIPDTQPPVLDDADWRIVLEKARAGRVAPLIYRRGGEGDAVLPVPGGMQRALHRASLATAARNTGLAYELQRLVTCFGEEDLPVLLLKGLYLAEHVYGNLAARPASDLDILIQRHDIDRADACLCAHGYVLAGGRDWHLAHHYHAVYTAPGTGACVEVHWHIAPPASPFQQDVTRLWADARAANVRGTRVLVLSPEHTLLHLAVHGAFQHAFQEGLRALCDVAACLHRFGGDLDWDEFVRTALAWRAGKCVALTLALAEELLAAAVPVAVLDALCPGGVPEGSKAMAREIIFQGRSTSHRVAALWQKGSLGETLRFAASHVFLPRDVLAIEYGVAPRGWPIYACYPAMWLRRIRRHRGVLFGALRGDTGARAALDGAQKRNLLLDWMGT